MFFSDVCLYMLHLRIFYFFLLNSLPNTIHVSQTIEQKPCDCHINSPIHVVIQMLMAMVFHFIRVVYTTPVINICFIKRVMLYQMLPVRTICDLAPRFNALVTYLWRFSSIFHITISTSKNWFNMDVVKDLNNKYVGKHITCSL